MIKCIPCRVAGVAITELMLGVAIIGVVLGSAVPVLRSFQSSQSLDISLQRLDSLVLQSRSTSSFNESDYRLLGTALILTPEVQTTNKLKICNQTAVPPHSAALVFVAERRDTGQFTLFPADGTSCRDAGKGSVSWTQQLPSRLAWRTQKGIAQPLVFSALVNDRRLSVNDYFEQTGYQVALASTTESAIDFLQSGEACTHAFVSASNDYSLALSLRGACNE